MVNVWANPIFGIGLNDWVRPDYLHSSSVDNFWLLTTMRFGIPGFIVLALGYGAALWQMALRPFAEGTVLFNLRRAWMFTFMGLTFSLVTVDVWTTVYSFVFFLFGAGIWMLEADAEAAAAPADGTRYTAASDQLRGAGPVLHRSAAQMPMPGRLLTPAPPRPDAAEAGRIARPLAPQINRTGQGSPILSRFPTRPSRARDSDSDTP